METFSLAWAKNHRQVVWQSFGQKGEDKGQVVEWPELRSRPIAALLIPRPLLCDELQARALDLKVPFGLIEEPLENPDYQKACQALDKTLAGWTLQNNLSLLRELFAHLAHLKALFLNDRNAFFEELWPILKNNLGAFEIKIVHNHLKDKRLTRVIVEGDRFPNPVENPKLGEALMNNYEGRYTEPWKIAEESGGKLVALASINRSPILVMARTRRLSALQHALLKTLFDGLQVDSQ